MSAEELVDEARSQGTEFIKAAEKGKHAQEVIVVASRWGEVVMSGRGVP
jgi:hypothetical protein